MELLGIDIGGTGVKGAVVDLKKGRFATDRLRIETPRPATPESVAPVVAEIARHVDWKGPIGCTFPGVVMHGVVRTAPNLDDGWVGRDAGEVFGDATGCDVTVLNDADAAGIAELAYGSAHRTRGVVLLLTLGTGIGSALLYHGHLIPNSELGHLELHGSDAEKWCADSVREREGLSWEEWTGRLSEYLQHVEDVVWPDLIVLGGGVSKEADTWLPLVRCRTEVVAAELKNKAGIIGAARHAAHQHGHDLD